MTADRVNMIVANAASRLDDANEALILNLDASNRKGEVIDEVKYERDGTVIVWGYFYWKKQGDELILWCNSIAGGGTYQGRVSIAREQNVEEDLISVLGLLLSHIQKDYIDEGP